MNDIKKIYRVILAIIGSIGIILQIRKDGISMVLYYTIISNVITIIFLWRLVFLSDENVINSRREIGVKGGITMAIAITFVIYHFMLSPYIPKEDFYNLRNFIVHYFVPIGMILDTLIFDIKKSYSKFAPFFWTIIPLIYFGFAILNGMVLKLDIPGSPDSPFPYFFMNVYKLGWENVALISISIFAIYIFWGYMLVFIKRYIGKKA